MIGFLTGLPKELGKDTILIYTKGGVGYKVYVLSKNKEMILKNEEINLFIHTITKEPNIDLYGFQEQNEYSTFLLLISVNGIGPKKALAMLNSIDPETLLSSIKTKNFETLVNYGISKKIAEKIILELNSKIEIDVKDSNLDLVTALIGLGYSKQEITNAIQKISKDTTSLKEQIKETLQIIRTL